MRFVELIEKEGLNMDEKMNTSIPIEVKCLSLVGDIIYFFPEAYNQLYSFNIKKGLIDSLGRIPWEKENENRLIEKIVRIKNTLYLIPFNAKYLSLYNIDTHTFDKIDIRKDRIKGVFGDGFSVDDYLYIIGGSAPCILKVDIINKRVDKFDKWTEDVKNLIFDKSDGYFRSQGILYDDKFITPFCNANAIMVFYYRTMKYEIIKLDDENNGYSGITSCSDGYWLAPRKGEMCAVKCDKEYRIIKKIRFNDRGYYTGLIMIENKPVFFADSIVDGVDKSVSVRNHMSRISVDGDYLASTDIENCRLFLETKDGIVLNTEVRIPSDREEIIEWAYSRRNNSLLLENKRDNLDLFLLTVKTDIYGNT